MASPTRIEGDLYVAGSISSQQLTAPASSIDNAAIKANAGIAYTKLVPLTPITIELFPASTTVTALASRIVHIARAAGTLVDVEAILQTVATGADRTITVELKKSTGGAAYNSVMTTPIGFTNASAARTPVSGVINTTSYVDSDSFELSVAVAGAAGAQASGLTVTLWLAENPQ